jgi:site-specific recombinase XerD
LKGKDGAFRVCVVTIQELLGHRDVETPMIYTPMLNWGGKGVYSLMDRL